MKGKAADKNPSGKGGRGNAGRGGFKPPPRTGTVSAIGAFLDLGKEMNHGSVSAWMRKSREYTRTNYKSDICDIFGNEGIPGEYPALVAPADIAEDANFMQIARWKKTLDLYDKKITELETDKKQVFGLMLCQISETLRRLSAKLNRAWSRSQRRTRYYS